MKPCKAKLQDGKHCPNQVDEGQEYCPFHLAAQNTKAKNIFSILVTVLGIFASVLYKVVKFVVSKKL
jgi:hypothetical protein